MKPLLTAILLALSLPGWALDVAPKFGQAGLDISDLWYNHNESGWGLNVIQQGDTSFATLFVYGSGGQPTWYVASALTYTGFEQATGDYVHVGDLYQTTGPAFSGTFDPSAVTVRRVGTMTLRVRISGASSQLYTGTVSYTIDGVTVTKAIERQTWRVADLAGTYDAMLKETWSGCTNTSANGVFVSSGTLTVTQTGTTVPQVTLRFAEQDGFFTYTVTGSYYQAGRNGSMPSVSLARTFSSGTSDSGGGYGIDLASGTTGFSGEFFFSGISAFPGCTTVSRLVGVR